MQFTQLSGALYFYSDAGTSATANVYFLVVDGSQPGGTITFDAAWNSTGVYIFLPAPLSTDPGTFITAALNFVNDPSKQGARFVWFTNPGASSLIGSYIQVGNAQGTIKVAFQASFTVPNTLQLFINRMTVVAPNGTNDGFTFTASDNSQIFITTSKPGSPQINVAVPTLNVTFTGNLSGCLLFQIAPTVDEQTLLDIGLRYYYAKPLNNAFPNQPGNFTLISLRYPIFSATATLYASLDVLQPQTAARTFFAFNAADAGQSGSTSPVASNYNSILGYTFKLSPQPGSKLIFCVNSSTSQLNPQDPYTLVPSGQFQLQSTQPGNVTQSLMCGLSGVEYVPLTGATNTLEFFPGQDAFATGFFPGEIPGYTSLTPAATPTTSFAYLTSSNSTKVLQYFAQPDQSVLYNVSATFPSVNIPALGPVPVEANTLTLPQGTSAYFPLLPYSGLSSQALEPFQQLEAQVISQRRRLAISKTGLPVPPVPPVTLGPSVTPQGLLVDYQEGDTQWKSVVLAQMGARQFMMTAVKGQLLAALESNQLFLVISDPQSIAAYLGDPNDKIFIGSDDEAWTFNINPAKWTRSADISTNTILIVKFSKMSVAELAGQPDTSWTFPHAFNSSAAQTSKAIGTIIQTAAASTDTDFTTFNQVVADPNWNGILILNATAPLTSLPAQLAGLAAGIDPSKFYAHHVGINVSQIVVPSSSTGTLSIANSSIFGLINYQGPSLTRSKLDYQFNVEQLKVLFLNTSVAGFSSIIQLQINKLFSEGAKLQEPADNIVEMFGVYQKHVVNGVEQDSYAFQTPTSTALTFDMKSQVLNAVEISQGQFVTITSQSSTTLTQSQFAFWGVMDFKELAGFDVFSFGREKGQSAAVGLSFSKLSIGMSFDPQDTSGPGGQPVITFDFDASQITFDMAASKPRLGSFFSHFPLTLAGLTQAKEGTTPTSLGYMGVQTPLNQSLVSYPWYSLNFNLNLGSPGALVAQVGFVASLTAGWNPSDSQYAVFTGLKLPGSNGAKREISIEGIFDITFKTLEIMAVPDKNSFILILYGIAFSFLSFKFPPSGQVNFVLFGNPDSSTDTNLGWYAAYAKTGSSGGDSKASKESMIAAARPTGLLNAPERGQY